MSGLAGLPRWSIEVMRLVAMIAIALTVATVYTARGNNHDTVYWGCLYAGSLTQVGTTEPANCGRGSKISWNAQGMQGAPGISGLTTVRQTTGGFGGAGTSSPHPLVCEDGRVPIGSGYLMEADPSGGTVVSASYAVTGDEDNPYDFEYDSALDDDEYVWLFVIENTVADAEFSATLWAYCAWVEPTLET